MSIQIRRATYRRVEGYLICGRRTGQQGGWGVSIFTLTRSSADHIAAKVRRGEDITLADFAADTTTGTGR